MVTPVNIGDPVVPVTQVPDTGRLDVPVVPDTATQAPVVTPTSPAPAAPAPTSVAPAPPLTPLQVQPSEVEILRRQLADINAARQAEATEATLLREMQDVYREELTQGQSEADATRIARRHYDLAKRVNQQQGQLREQQAYLQGKQNAALQIGAQHGVSPALLMSANTPEEMVAIAQREKHYASLEADIKQLKQGQVPAQTLDGANVTRAGAVTVTSDNIDKLWFDHETAYPNTPNPYQAAYRKLLSG